MKTVYEVIWSIVGVILIIWFFTNLAVNVQHAAVRPPETPVHQKQSIKEFLNDHPDIKKRVDEMERQAELDGRYKQS